MLSTPLLDVPRLPAKKAIRSLSRQGTFGTERGGAFQWCSLTDHWTAGIVGQRSALALESRSFTLRRGSRTTRPVARTVGLRVRPVAGGRGTCTRWSAPRVELLPRFRLSRTERSPSTAGTASTRAREPPCV